MGHCITKADSCSRVTHNQAAVSDFAQLLKEKTIERLFCSEVACMGLELQILSYGQHPDR